MVTTAAATSGVAQKAAAAVPGSTMPTRWTCSPLWSPLVSRTADRNRATAWLDCTLIYSGDVIWSPRDVAANFSRNGRPLEFRRGKSALRASGHACSAHQARISARIQVCPDRGP